MVSAGGEISPGFSRTNPGGDGVCDWGGRTIILSDPKWPSGLVKPALPETPNLRGNASMNLIAHLPEFPKATLLSLNPTTKGSYKTVMRMSSTA